MNLPDVDPKTIAEHEESVFSASISPNELYQELVASYYATAVVDLSPAQGKFCEACLASRTKAVAVCGTESHGSRLELLLTAHILGELSREGSIFFRPESVAKEGEGSDGKDKTETDKTSGKKKSPTLTPRRSPSQKRNLARPRRRAKMPTLKRRRKAPTPIPRRSPAKPRRKTTTRKMNSPLKCGERLKRLE